MTQFTASEVRDLAKRGTDAMQQFIDGRHTLHIPPQHDDADMVIAECLRAMDAFAYRLEADEKAEPMFEQWMDRDWPLWRNDPNNPNVARLQRMWNDTHPQPAQDAKGCMWSEDEEGNWDTGCGNMFVLTEGTPYDNEMGFCCYCGGKLDQVTQADAAMAKESGR